MIAFPRKDSENLIGYGRLVRRATGWFTTAFPDSIALLNWCQHRAGTAVVAWHSLSNIYYLLSRQKAPGMVDAKDYLRDLLKFVIVVSTGTAQAKIALGLPMQDFEDALQVSAALHAGVDYIITRNQNHYRSSPVRALTPTEFLAH